MLANTNPRHLSDLFRERIATWATSQIRRGLIAVVVCALVATGCGTEQMMPPAEQPAGAAADQAEALERLGVNTEETPRIDPKGNALPESYTPMGPKHTLGAKAELYLAGAEVTPEDAATDQIATLFQDMSCRADDTCEPISVLGMALDTRDTPSAPWLLENINEMSNPQTRRATASADVDGDGFDEIVSVYCKGADEIRVNVTDDESGDFAVEDILVGRLANVTHVSVAAGDFDGDGVAELALGLCVPSKAHLWFLSDQNDGFIRHASLAKTIDGMVPNGTMSLELAAGNLDYDAGSELVAVVNEIKDFCSPIADCRLFVYDDAAAQHDELMSGPVQERTSEGTLRTSVASSVALGDIDADGVNEIILAGLTGFPGCTPNDCDAPPAVLIALDDAVAGFKSLGAALADFSTDDCLVKVRYLHVNTLDIDGDNIAEVQVNQFFYDDWRNEAPWTKLPYALPASSMYGTWNDPDTYQYGRHTSAMAVGDVTGDGLDDVMFTGLENGVQKLLVYASNAKADTPDMTRLYAKAIAFDSNPIMVAANADVDGSIMEFVEGSHSLVYTEPIVLAVLAAPPCLSGDGQNTDACSTSFGNSSSIGTEEELGFTVSVGVVVGVSVEDRTFTQSAIDISASLKTKLGVSASHSYTLTKSVVRSTGPMEDGVIFLTQPMDRYVYKILSHVEPELIGTVVDVWLPRDPMIMLAEREFYNASVTEGSIKIDESILQHTIGDPSSYPTQGQKDQIMASFGGNPLMQNGPHSVGQGNGETELSIEVAEEFSAGASLALEFEFEAETTLGGYKVGASFGFEAERSFALTAGTATTYTGVVGNISADRFADDQYRFGLFTYRHSHPATGQQFEVINYWVE